MTEGRNSNTKFLQELYEYALKVALKAFKSTTPEWAKENYEQHIKKREESLKSGYDIFRDNEFSIEETEFLTSVCESVKSIGRNPALIKLNRLSDKTLNV